MDGRLWGQLYTANEQGNSVSAYRMDSVSGVLTHLETLPTVPDAFAAVSHCAEIKFSPDGRWLFAPNRALPATGCCSVAVFAVDGTTGALRLSEICIVADVPENFSPQHIALDTALGQVRFEACAPSLASPSQLLLLQSRRGWLTF